MKQHDAVFFFGDTNYRVDVDRPTADAQIVQHRAYKEAGELKAAQAALSPLLQKDQLLHQRDAATRQSSCRPVRACTREHLPPQPSALSLQPSACSSSAGLHDPPKSRAARRWSNDNWRRGPIDGNPLMATIDVHPLMAIGRMAG